MDAPNLSGLQIALLILVVIVLARAAYRGHFLRSAMWLTVFGILGYVINRGINAGSTRAASAAPAAGPAPLAPTPQEGL